MMTLNNFCSFKCPWLNCNEAKQNYIRRTTGIFPIHQCIKFDKRLYHHGYEPGLLRCHECREAYYNMLDNPDMPHNYVVFKDGTKELITAYFNLTNTDLLFSIKGSNYTYLFKTDDFNNLAVDLFNSDKICAIKKPSHCFYRAHLDEIVNPRFPLFSEDYWTMDYEIDHIEICTEVNYPS